MIESEERNHLETKNFLDKIISLEEKTENLQIQIIELEDKILALENLFKCYLCKKLKILANCEICNVRICNQCYICSLPKSINTENDFIYYCRKCIFNN
jgi:hypothetical protein